MIYPAAIDDFMIVNSSTVIPPGVSEACIQFVAIDDELIEDEEHFSVVVEVGNPNDIVYGNTTVTILDNDGILKCMALAA